MVGSEGLLAHLPAELALVTECSRRPQRSSKRRPRSTSELGLRVRVWASMYAGYAIEMGAKATKMLGCA